MYIFFLFIIILAILILINFNFNKELFVNFDNWNSTTKIEDNYLWKNYNIYHAKQNNHGYYKFLPSSYKYPNSKNEINQVINAMNNRTKYDEELYFYTDISIVTLFENILKYYKINEKYNLDKVTKRIIDNILKYKALHNRIRPYQLDPDRVIPLMLKNTTGHTPAYPAGHAVQAYYLAKYLSEKHPNIKDILFNYAKLIDDVRVKAGIHYPSDGKYAYELVMSKKIN